MQDNCSNHFQDATQAKFTGLSTNNEISETTLENVFINNLQIFNETKLIAMLEIKKTFILNCPIKINSIHSLSKSR